MSGKDGRRRFDPDGNNPFAYVNVLLYTQQFEAAVSFLHWKGFHLAVNATSDMWNCCSLLGERVAVTVCRGIVGWSPCLFSITLP